MVYFVHFSAVARPYFILSAFPLKILCYFAAQYEIMRANAWIYCASIALVLLSGCAGSKKATDKKNLMPGTWQATPIVIDGDNGDWPSPYPNYDSKGKIAYATSNDARYLYITMETGDELTQLKMLKYGMTVSIDTGGKRNTPFSIDFPLANDNSELDIPITPDGQKESAMQFEKQLYLKVHKAIDLANQLTFEGFSACSGGYMAGQANPCGIKVKARVNTYKELIWEAAIPVKALYGKETLTAADAGHPISVCYYVKGGKAPKSGNVDNANGGYNQTPGGGSRNAAMGMPQGGGRKAENPLEHLYTPTRTWKQFSLVVQP